MRRGIREWKACARQALRGNYLLPILGLIMVSVVNLMSGSVAAVLFPGTSVGALVLSQIFLFILSLVLSVLSAGLSYMYLNIARGREYSFGNLFYFFRNHPDRVIIAALVLGVISFVAAIPVNYFSFTAEMGTTMESQYEWMRTYLLLFILSLLVDLFVSIPFTLSYYLLADHLEMGGLEALKTSLGMMKGNFGRYLLLQVSFFPWFLLSIFTLYIALLWVLPYMEMAGVMFYRDLNGELDPEPEHLSVETIFPPGGDQRDDDYNAEA